MHQESLASGQERHPARGAREELCAELVLEVADRARERGLRDVKSPGRAMHVAFFGDDDEVLELSETHALKLARTWTRFAGDTQTVLAPDLRPSPRWGDVDHVALTP